MGRKRKNELYNNLNSLTEFEVYDYVVNGIIPRFPPGFVTKENMKKLIREVILNKEKLSREEICQKISYEYLKKYRLRGSRNVFGDNIYTLVSYCFPEMEIKYWELNKVQDGFWQKEENRKEYMVWLIEKEHIDPSKISDLKRITSNMIDKNHGIRARKYGGSVYNLILLIAKVGIKEWQLTKVSNWTEEKVREAVKWLIEEKMKWSHDDVVKNISVKTFYDYELGGMLARYCNHSPLRALQIAYPGEYKKVKNSKPKCLSEK